VPDTYDALGMAAAPDALNGEYTAIINEARGAIAGGRGPDAKVLEERIRSVTRRHSGSAAAERKALKQLERVLSIQRARGALARQPAPPAASTPLRKVLRARPTLTGNMDVRREKRGEAFVLAWDAAAGVAQWEVRISERADARSDYAVRETLTREATETSLELPLGDRSLRVHVLGRSRDGRLLRRAVISALTRDSWTERWQRRASAS
jgi:hypothetical protein